MKVHTKLPSYKASSKCIVPVRPFHCNRTQINSIRSNPTLQGLAPSFSINNLRTFGCRSFAIDTTNKNDVVVLQKQITVAMNEKDFSKAITLLQKLKDLSQDDKVLHDGKFIKLPVDVVVYEKLGLCYHGISKSKESIECYTQSLALAKKLNDPKKITKSLSLLGSLQVGTQDYENGNATLKEGLRLAVELKDPLLRGKPLNSKCNLAGHINSSLGISFSNQDIPDAAIKYFMDSLEDFKEARNLEVVQRITRLIAQEYAKMNAFELSNSYWEQFLKYSRNSDDKQAQFKVLLFCITPNPLAKALSNIATNFMKISKPRDSKITFEKALSLAKELQSPQFERECLIGLAKACEVLGETDQAKKYSNEALKISQDNMDVSGEINALIVRATQSIAAKDFDSCMEDAEKILQLSVKYNHKGGEMYGRILSGAVAEHQQEWTTAKDHFEKALTLAKFLKDAQSIRRCQDMLSVIYLNLRNFSASLPLLHDLLKAFESEKDDMGRLRCLSRMYLCYKNLGKQQHAEIYLKLTNILANQLVEQGVIPSLDQLSGILPNSTA